MNDVTVRRSLDAGQPLPVGGSDGPGFLMTVRACAARRCPCSMVALELVPVAADSHDELVPELDRRALVRADLDVKTREVTRIEDASGLLGGAQNERWLRDDMTGRLGDKVAARFERVRASKDRRTWQAYDWAAHEKGTMVAFHALFPHDWDIMLSVGGQRAWVQDIYCVQPGCSCQEVAVDISGFDGERVWSHGGARLRLVGGRDTIVVDYDRDAARFLDAMFDLPRIEMLLHDRMREMRGVARRRKTWHADVAAPAQAIERLVSSRIELTEDDIDRVFALGECATAVLVASAQDESAMERRRIRAVRLLSVIDDPKCAAPLAEALIWPALRSDADAVEEVIQGLIDLREAALEPLLAALPAAGDAAEMVMDVLSDLRIPDARILNLLAERARADPARWVDALEWQGHAALPLVRGLLDALMATEPLDWMTAQQVVHVNEALGGEVDDQVVKRIDDAEAMANERLLEDVARSDAAKAERRQAAQLALAELDRRPRPSRNAPCWCGSGTKYKKCHLASDEAERQALLDGPGGASAIT